MKYLIHPVTVIDCFATNIATSRRFFWPLVSFERKWVHGCLFVKCNFKCTYPSVDAVTMATLPSNFPLILADWDKPRLVGLARKIGRTREIVFLVNENIVNESKPLSNVDDVFFLRYEI